MLFTQMTKIIKEHMKNINRNSFVEDKRNGTHSPNLIIELDHAINAREGYVFYADYVINIKLNDI